MKRLSMIMVCLLAMMAVSLSAKAQDVTITLYPGWNWISYPKAEVLDVNTALGDFVPMNGDKLQSQFSNSSFSNGQWRGGVTHFMPGWGYKYYSNRTEVVSFVFGEAAPQLTVITEEPTEITAISAISGGLLSSSDGSYITVLEKGICWATHPNPTVMNDYHTENGGGINSFAAEMTDLDVNTLYYVRAYAVSENGTTYGEEISFTTRDGIPMVSLDSITNIRGNSAICHGTVVDNGGLDVISRGVCWSINHNPTLYDSFSIESLGLGCFYTSIIDLTVNTTYYIRAYASTSYGTGYGEEMMFTTQNGIPVVSTDSVSDVLCNTATIEGTVINDGGLDVIARGVCWSTIQNPTLSDNHIENGLGLGSFIITISDLILNTTYYVRTYASTSQGIGYGEEVCFTTLEFPQGAINGLFSVSDNQQVYFSEGNLQYIGSASIPYWKFADNQWDYFGTSTIQNSSNQNIDRDLFGWGTSGYNHGAVCYEPWSTSTNSTYYFAYGNYYANLTGGQADWGYNSISNGGNQLNQWRTLTSQEWKYVFNTRITASGIRYAKAIVNGINGVILLPDDWSGSCYMLNNTNQNNANYSSNMISGSQWSILEQHGAVFLPAAGWRSGTSVLNNQHGNYWSASYANSSSDYACSVHFDNSSIDSGYADYRSSGFSVRLVSNAE